MVWSSLPLPLGLIYTSRMQKWMGNSTVLQVEGSPTQPQGTPTAYNPTPERLLACDLVNIEDGNVQHMNSWEAVLQRVKVEYLGLSSNIQDLRYIR